MNREILLGYLMDALEDDEVRAVEQELHRNPALRQELDALRKELIPLSTISRDVFAPPWGLAERTCAGLWTQIDRAAQHSETKAVPAAPFHSSSPFSSPIPPPHRNRLKILGEIIAASPQDADPVRAAEPAVKMITGKAELETAPQHSTVSAHLPVSSIPPHRHRPLPTISGDTRPIGTSNGWRWADLIASVGIGVLVACIAFPAINYAKNRTQTLVTQSKLNEIGNKFSLYSQLEGRQADPDELETPQSRAVNLATANWEKVDPREKSLLALGSNSNVGVLTPAQQPATPFHYVVNQSSSVDENAGRTLFLGQAPTPSAGKSCTTLFKDVERIIPVSNGSFVQPAYGQNILFVDGHIFFRVLPIFEKNPVELPVE